MSKLWYESWAQNRNEALPVGNGRVGALVYGNPYRDTLSLNEETLWSGAPYGEEPPYDSAVLEKARQLIAQKEFSQAETYLNENLMKGIRSQTYLPLGKLSWELKHNHLMGVLSYRRELDLQQGILSSVAEILCRQNSLDDRQEVMTQKKTYFVSLTEDVLVVHLESDRAISSNLSLDLQLPGTVTYKGQTLTAKGRCFTFFDENDRENSLQFDENKESVPYAVAVGIQTDGHVYGEGATTAIYGAKEVTVILSIATGFNGYDKQPISQGKDYEKQCMETLERAMAIPYEELKRRHIAFYKSQYDRSEVCIEGENRDHIPTDRRLALAQRGEEDVTLAQVLFDYGKYLMISSSQPGGQATNLQGIWNEEALAPWNCNYTLNINTQMNYWAAELVALPECHLPLMELTRELAQRGNAYGLSGWCTPHNTDLWRFNRMATRYAMYGLWDMGGLWLARHIYDHYCYTLDKDFLEKYIDVLRGVYDFLADRLTEDAEGYLILSPSTSPETMYLHQGQVCSVTGTAAMDLQMIEDYLAYMQELEDVLGGDTRRYAAMAKKLRPQVISQEGKLLEYGEELQETEDQHQHLSHLYGIYPGSSIHKGTALYDAARKALDDRMARGGGNNGWANIWAGLCYARFADGEKAYESIQRMITHTLYPNLLNICPPFQIDGNFGVSALVCEMLLQSDKTGIHTLPALPKAWKKGYVRGLKIRGGATVSFRWEDGKVFDLQIN